MDFFWGKECVGVPQWLLRFCNDVEHVGPFNEYPSAIGYVLNGTFNDLGLVILIETN